MGKYGEVAVSFAGRSLDLKKDEVILVWCDFGLSSRGSESAPVLVIMVLREVAASFSRAEVSICSRNEGDTLSFSEPAVVELPANKADPTKWWEACQDRRC